jgi:hypothetical protein
MAIDKPTKTSDIKDNMLGETSEAPVPERASVADLSDQSVLVDAKSPKTVKVTSPLGQVTEVPEGIVDALLDSGYSKSK